MSSRPVTVLRLAAFGLFIVVSASLGTACGGDVSCEEYCGSLDEIRAYSDCLRCGVDPDNEDC